MPIRTTVNTISTSSVSINNQQKATVRSFGTSENTISTSRVSINNQQKESVRTFGVAPRVAATKLTELTDIQATNASNNETLVYDGQLDKFVAKELPVINGGTF